MIEQPTVPHHGLTPMLFIGTDESYFDPAGQGFKVAVQGAMLQAALWIRQGRVFLTLREQAIPPMPLPFHRTISVMQVEQVVRFACQNYLLMRLLPEYEDPSGPPRFVARALGDGRVQVLSTQEFERIETVCAGRVDDPTPSAQTVLAAIG